jgi:hypothetical protein
MFSVLTDQGADFTVLTVTAATAAAVGTLNA